MIWSKLHRQVKLILRHNCDLKLEVYRMKSQRGCTDLPAYKLTKDGGTIWKFPDPANLPEHYPYHNISIGMMIQEYLNTPKSELVQLQDDYGLFEALRKVDRRLVPEGANERILDGTASLT